MRTGGTHLEFLCNPGGQGQQGVASKGPKSILYIAMLHLKSKVMKSRMQWCKSFAQGACLGVTRGQKVGFWVLFFFFFFVLIVIQLLGFLS